jgi:hypothetical protein
MQSIGSAETRSYDEPYLEKQTQNHLEGGQEGTLELVKITDRLAGCHWFFLCQYCYYALFLALLFPTNGPDGVYRAQIKSASERVKRTYEKYKVHEN